MTTSISSLHSWVTGENESRRNFWTLDTMSKDDSVAMAMLVAFGIETGWMSYSSASTSLGLALEAGFDDYKFFFPEAAKEALQEKPKVG